MNKTIQYDDMKDSGLQWIGKIPCHWKTARMKEIFQNITDKGHPDAEVLSLYREYGVLPKNSRDDNHNITSKDTGSYKYVQVGDLVINKMKAWQGSLGVSDYAGIVSPAYYVCHFRSEKFSKKYFHYLLRCRAYAQEFERLSTGMRVGQWDLNIDDFMTVPAVVPLFEEQQAIASFLDDQCAQIDAIIADTKAGIETYKQLRESVIFEAVTKGLQNNTAMRDSGIDIVGKIPQRWCLRRLRFLCDISTGNQDTQDSDPEGQYPFYVRSPIVEKSNTYTFDCEGILMAGDGAGAGRVFHHAHGKYAVHQRVYCFRNFRDVLPRFLYYYMSCLFSHEMDKGSAKSTVPSVRLPMLLNFNIVLPSSEEQVLICNYLDKKTALIDSIITQKQNLINDLETFKRSLIYETVTGKRKVV